MTESKRYIEEDEIDLRELWKTIVKRKNFIFIFTSIVTIGAIIWAITRTPIYEARALIEIGNYKMHNNNNNNNKIILDDSAQLSKKLNILFIDMLKNEKDKEATISSIKVPKGLKEFIEIKSLSSSNKFATKEIKEVVNYIKSQHKNILDEVKQRREIEIKNIDAKIVNIKNKAIPLLENKIKLQEKTLLNFKNQINLISNNLKKIESSDPSLTALMLMEKRDLTTLIISLNTQLMDMRDKKESLATTTINNLNEDKLLSSSLILSHNYKNTQIVGEIITNDYPIKPKKKLIVTVAFVTGLILSIFLVFFLEFVGKKDEEIK